jgi:hydroxyacylglutathione hydrolase
MNVEVLASGISDNFFYAIIDESGEAALVDPIDGARAVEYIAAEGLELAAVINTHFHHDHVLGNDAVFEAFPEAQLWAGSGDADRIEAQQSRRVDRRLGAGDVVRVGAAELEILDTPGHTPGHISVLGAGHLFSGDTIFAGGVGNCSFGGDPGVLFRTFRDVLGSLSDDVIFYPGHDYSLRNLEFIASIEPDNQGALDLLAEERSRSAADDSVGHRRQLTLRTLGEERGYNPFFRVGDEELIRRLESERPEVFAQAMDASTSREEAAFRALRELRNRW